MSFIVKRKSDNHYLNGYWEFLYEPFYFPNKNNAVNKLLTFMIVYDGWRDKILDKRATKEELLEEIKAGYDITEAIDPSKENYETIQGVRDFIFNNL